MAKKEIVRLGNPILRKVSDKLTLNEINSPEVRELLIDMYDTMQDLGGFGIAAPQIGISKQIAIIEIPFTSTRYKGINGSDKYVIINPKITILNNKTLGFWEGCLSIPGLRGYVKRPSYIKVDYLDENANEIRLELNDFLSIVFQHEIDHLNGKVFLDRVNDTKLISYIEEYERFLQEE